MNVSGLVEFTENLGSRPDLEGLESLGLTFEQRCRARQRLILADGRQVGLILERGKLPGEGDVLKGSGGDMLRVALKPEPVVTARASDWLGLCRAAYHLGNRHVSLEIGDLWLGFKPDSVLEDLAARLGLEIVLEERAFNPEWGAYHHHD